MFGSGTAFPSSNPTQQQGFSPYNVVDSDMEAQSLSSEMWRLAQVFLHFPENKQYPFRHTFLNSSQTWSQNAASQVNGYDYIEAVHQAGKYPGGGKGFVPMEVVGFTGLQDRVNKQDTVVRRHNELLQEFKQHVDGRSQDCKKVRELLAKLKQEQNILLHQLLKVLRKLDQSEQTIATEWHNGKFHRTDSGAVAALVHALEKKVSGSSPNELLSRISEASRMEIPNRSNRDPGTMPEPNIDMKDLDSDELHTSLRNHQRGIKQMQLTLSKLQIDIDIMQGNKLS